MNNLRGNSDQIDQSSHHFQILKGMLNKFDISSFSAYIEQKEQSKEILNPLLIYALQLIHHNQILTYEIIDLLLSKGASPDIVIQFSFNQYFIDEKDKVTLLLFSLLTKDIELFSIVIKYSPDIKLRDAKNLNAILYYVLYNRDEDVKMLLDLIGLNADVNSNAEVKISPKVYEWHSVFTIACRNNMKKSIRILIDNGVEVNFIANLSRNTGIHLALIEGHIELVTMLIRINGIRLDIENKDGLKAIDIAKMKGKKIFALFTHQHNDSDNSTTPMLIHSRSVNDDEINNSIIGIEESKENNTSLNISHSNIMKKESTCNNDKLISDPTNNNTNINANSPNNNEQTNYIANQRKQYQAHQGHSNKISLEFKGDSHHVTNIRTDSSFISKKFAQ